MSTAFLRHWYVRGAPPEAATEKLAAAPSQTVAPAGCAVIDGSVFTVSTASALVTEPHPFVTTTE